MSCICGQLMLGSEPSGSFNLNPDCKLHGYESDWFNSPEQIEHRLTARARSVELQLQAREARRKARQLETGDW